MIKNKILLFLLLLSVLVFAGKGTALAQEENENEDEDEVCFCHNASANNPSTFCSSSEGAIGAHQAHVTSGMDTNGACSPAPSVPEFGLLTGIGSLILSAGSYKFIKSRNK